MAPNLTRIISDRERINDDLVEKLEQALAKAKEGNVEGFCLVILSESVENIGFFEDRLRMLGALHMALHKTSDMADSE